MPVCTWKVMRDRCQPYIGAYQSYSVSYGWGRASLYLEKDM